MFAATLVKDVVESELGLGELAGVALIGQGTGISLFSLCLLTQEHHNER